MIETPLIMFILYLIASALLDAGTAENSFGRLVNPNIGDIDTNVTNFTESALSGAASSIFLTARKNTSLSFSPVAFTATDHLEKIKNNINDFASSEAYKVSSGFTSLSNFERDGFTMSCQFECLNYRGPLKLSN